MSFERLDTSHSLKSTTFGISEFLPAFEERDRSDRRTSKGSDAKVWTTNCPKTISPPQLFPGEVVQLQQNRILHVGSTNVPLIGALFITNYRFIFWGDPISNESSKRFVQEYQNGQLLQSTATKTMQRINFKTEKFREYSRKAQKRLTLRGRGRGEDKDTEDFEEIALSGEEMEESQSQQTKGTPKMLQNQSWTRQTPRSSDSPHSTPLSSQKQRAPCDVKIVDFENVPTDFDCFSEGPLTEEGDDGSTHTSESEEEQDDPTALTKSIATHLAGSRLSVLNTQYKNHNYMNFSFSKVASSTSVTSRSATVNQDKPPVPTPRANRSISTNTLTVPTQGPAPKGPAPQGPAPKGPAPKGPAPQGPAPKGPAPQGPAPKVPAPQGPAISSYDNDDSDSSGSELSRESTDSPPEPHAVTGGNGMPKGSALLQKKGRPPAPPSGVPPYGGRSNTVHAISPTKPSIIHQSARKTNSESTNTATVAHRPLPLPRKSPSLSSSSSNNSFGSSSHPMSVSRQGVSTETRVTPRDNSNQNMKSNGDTVTIPYMVNKSSEQSDAAEKDALLQKKKSTIKEMMSYENFLPIAWRNKSNSACSNKDVDSRGVEGDIEMRPDIRERRSFRQNREVSPQSISEKEDLMSRKSFTLPQKNSVSSLSYQPPVFFNTLVSCPVRSVYQIRRIQSSVALDGVVPGVGLQMRCKNFHSFKFYIHPHNTYDRDGLKKILEDELIKPRALDKQFAFAYRREVSLALSAKLPIFLKEKSKFKNTFSITEEAKRLGFLDSPIWHISSLLKNKPQVCASYPPEVIVPRPTPDVDLERAAPFYRENRFPVATWRCNNGAILFRGAAAIGKRGSSVSRDDQSLLQQICGCLESQDDIKLYVFTERSDLILKNLPHTLSLEQKEIYFYSGVKFVYPDRLPTVKNVQHSFNKLANLLENRYNSSYLSALEDSGWLHRLSDILALACEISLLLREGGTSVLVAYECGRDLTTQIVSLVQLLSDSHYRTIKGFQMLIQKEWLRYSHPFATRNGQAVDGSDEVGPIFLQWVDAVWQVLQQFPSAFEFNEDFLETLVHHSLSGMFGTFLTDSHQERQDMMAQDGTIAFWTWVEICNETDKRFHNQLFSKDLYPGFVLVNFEVPCLQLWSSYYCHWRSEWNCVNHKPLLKLDLETIHEICQEVRSKCLPLEALLQGTEQSGLKRASIDLLDADLSQSLHGHSLSNRVAQDIFSKHRSARAQTKLQDLSGHLQALGVDPTISQHVHLKEQTCCGYLIKQGGRVRNWKKRWFILDFSKGYLCYFKNEEAAAERTHPLGVLNLQDIKEVYQKDRDDHLTKNIFNVVTPNRTYQMRAPTLLTLEIWLKLLQIPLQ